MGFRVVHGGPPRRLLGPRDPSGPCPGAARGWAWVAWDWDWERLDVYIGDAQNTFPVWNATPILALDVYEHSYVRDFSTARPKYIDAFVANIDWADVSARFERIASVAQ